METQSQVSTSDFSIIEDLVTPDDFVDAKAMEESMVMIDKEGKPFKQVEFDGFCKLSSGDFSVRYRVNPSFKARSSDRIALYEVGFVAPHDYRVYRWATIPENPEVVIPLTVIFPAKLVPKPSATHYQFCYLNHALDIIGVSHPFLIPTEEEVDEKVVANSKLDSDYEHLQAGYKILQERSSELATNNQGLLKSHTEVSKELQETRSACEKLKEDIKTITEKLELAIAEKIKAEKTRDETQEHLDETKKTVDKCQERIHFLENQVADLKSSFLMSKQMHDVSEERLASLEQENLHLKELVLTLRERTTRLEEALRESEEKKEAAETVASELSRQLQTESAEKTKFMTRSERLNKRVMEERNNLKTFQHKMLMSTSSLDEISTVSFDDFESEAGERAVKEPTESYVHEQPRARKPILTESVMDTSVCSNCSLGAQKLSEVVETKMESMVHSLTSQMAILRDEIAKVHISSNTPSMDTASQHSDPRPVEANPFNLPSSSLSIEKQDMVLQQLPKLDVKRKIPTEEIPPIMRNNHARSKPSEITKPIVIAASPRAPSPRTALPEPLQPETTLTACQAAVMRLVNQTETSKNTDHDEDEYQSADEAADAPNELFCPVCDVKFQTNSIVIMEDHVNSHLEYVCPICSRVFERRNQKVFEEHVQKHLEEEDLKEANGGWIGSSRFPLLDID